MIKGNYERLPDALKTGSNWLGESTYGTSFKCPNPEAYAHRVNHVEKYFKNGDYSHQFCSYMFIKKQIIIMNS